MRCASLLALVALAGVARAAEAPADLVLRGGDILTQDPARPHARAVAVRGGVIVALDDVDPLVGPKHARDRAARPRGGSLAHRRARAPRRARLRRRRDRPARLQRRRPACAHAVAWQMYTPQRAGRGVRSDLDPRPRLGPEPLRPTASSPRTPTLDGRRPPGRARARRRPRLVGQRRRRCAAAPSPRATPDPPGGRIVRDARGAPTGIFVDTRMALIDARDPAADGGRDRGGHPARPGRSRSPPASPRCTTWA